MQMPEISRRRAVAYVAVLVALLVLGGRYALKSGQESTSAAPVRALVRSEPAPPRVVVVHVAGAVRRPGLYRLQEGSRIEDALEEAGGPRPRAALDLINLAAPVADGQQVLVPAQGPRGTVSAVEGAVPGGSGAPAAKVSLNTATLEQLDALPGVGPVTAQKILDYREEHGAFQSVEELDAVSGIGPARLEQLRELVQL